MNVSILVNTQYHHTTALSLYQNMLDCGYTPIFNFLCEKDYFKFTEMCMKHNFNISQEQQDISFVITAIEKENGLTPNINKINTNKRLIFVHHRPLSCEKLQDDHVHISNGIYEKQFSNNFFFQYNVPASLINKKNKKGIGVFARFNEGKIDVELLKKHINDDFIFVGIGSKQFLQKNKLKNNCIEMLDNYNFYKEVNNLKYLFLPYSFAKNPEYFNNKTSETLTLSLAYQIPLISEKKFLDFNSYNQINLDTYFERYDEHLLQIEKYREQCKKHNIKLFSSLIKKLS